MTGRLWIINIKFCEMEWLWSVFLYCPRVFKEGHKKINVNIGKVNPARGGIFKPETTLVRKLVLTLHHVFKLQCRETENTYLSNACGRDTWHVWWRRKPRAGAQWGKQKERDNLEDLNCEEFLRWMRKCCYPYAPAAFTPRNVLVLIFRGWVDPGYMDVSDASEKIPSDTIGNRSRELPTGTAAP